jgi:hypothetical protein
VESGKWQISKEGGQEPLWAHSGRELFYRRAGEVVAATVGVGPRFSVLRERPLFRGSYNRGDNAWSYDIAPDDRRFMMVEYVEGWKEESVDLVLVEHITDGGAGQAGRESP